MKNQSTPQAAQHTDRVWPVSIFYDASCRLCAAEMNNLRLRDTAHRLRFIDCSAADFSGGPAPVEALMQRLHCQDASGRVLEGVDAFRLIYRTVGLHTLDAALAQPMLGGLARRLYPWIARHRQRLPAWLIAPLFERAARHAAQAAAQRSQACQQGMCELAPPAADHAHDSVVPSVTSSNATGTRTVLLTGASGFIGQRIAQQLRAQGWHVLALSRSSQPRGDFAHMTRPEDWLPWLLDEHGQARVQAVINAVGALRDAPGRSLHVLHTEAPKALFYACAQAGIRRVIQVSALGITNSDTAYARTKRAADEHLLDLNQRGLLDGLVLRPSVVFGTGGASSQLFLMLARLPLLCLPQAALQQPIQPLAVEELAQAIVHWVDEQPSVTGLLELVGPQAMSMAAFIASLRQHMQRKPATVLPLPHGLSWASARVGDWISASPWCSQSWALMQTPNSSSSDALGQALGHPPSLPQPERV